MTLKPNVYRFPKIVPDNARNSLDAVVVHKTHGLTIFFFPLKARGVNTLRLGFISQIFRHPTFAVDNDSRVFLVVTAVG